MDYRERWELKHYLLGQILERRVRLFHAGLFILLVWLAGLGGTPTFAQAEPSGACCLPCGGCVDTCASECDAEGGLFFGEGTTCASVLCPLLLPGACCLPCGPCVDDVCVTVADGRDDRQGGRLA